MGASPPPATAEPAPGGGLRRAVSRGAAAALVLRAGGMGLAAVAAIALARAVGPAVYGTYSWAYAWVVALAVPATLGADQLLVRDAGVAIDRGERPRLRALVRSALVHVALAATAVAVIGLVLALAVGSPGARRSALLLALPILPLAAVAAVAQGALLGLGRTARALAPGTAGRQALFLVLVVAAGGLTASGAVALQLVATAAGTVAVLVLLARALGRGPATLRASERVAARDWLRTSVPMGAASMFLIIDAQVGLLVLGAVSDSSDAGVYAAALQCTAPFALLLAAGRLPLAPAIARLGAAGERERLQRGLRTATRAVAAVSAVAAAVLLIAPGAVLALFGDDFSTGEAAGALRLLALAQLVNAACAFNGMVLIMGGHERAAMRAALGCLALDIVLCVALAPPLGARGAAIAVLVAVTVRNVVNSIEVRRRLGVDATVIGRVPTRR